MAHPGRKIVVATEEGKKTSILTREREKKIDPTDATGYGKDSFYAGVLAGADATHSFVSSPSVDADATVLYCVVYCYTSMRLIVDLQCCCTCGLWLCFGCYGLRFLSRSHFSLTFTPCDSDEVSVFIYA